MNSKTKYVWGALVIAFGISVAVCLFIFFGIEECLNEKQYELYEVFIVSGFATTSLITITVLRYTLSRRHNEAHKEI